MITVHLMANVFGHGAARTVEVEWREGITCAELVREHRLPSYGPTTKLACSVNGHKLTREEMAMDMPNAEFDVVIAPDPEGIDPLTLIVGLVISFVVSFVYAKLVGQPSAGNTPQDRGDDRSQTRSWDRITSEYRPGFPVPLVFGEHDVGGQVIYVDLNVNGTGGGGPGPRELLRVIVVVSEGRIEAIGGETGGTLGEIDFVGGYEGGSGGVGQFPSDVRVNGNRLDPAQAKPGAALWARMGEVTQTPLTQAVFPGVSSVVAVNEELADLNDETIATISDARPISTVTVVWGFPGGLYAQSNTGDLSPYPLLFDVLWRPVGSGPFTFLGTYSVNVPATISSFAVQQTYMLHSTQAPPPVGPIEVKVKRNTAQGGQQVVSSSIFRQVAYALNQPFSYPRRALVGLDVLATAATTSARSNFLFRVKGLRVRVFDAVVSGSPSASRYWELPPAGDPYNGIWSFPPGQNPAWIFAEFLTNEAGLGEFVTNAMIDWPAIRNWADFCDQAASVPGGTEAYMACDLVVDQPQPAMEYLMMICQTGRAVPVMKGNLISVKYEYANGHGRGSNSVPAKQSTQLVSSGNVDNFSVQYFDTRGRPGVISAQFLNRDKDYVQDSIDVDDPNGGFNHPATVNPLGFTKQAMQMYGITRPTQIQREGLFVHDANRLVRSEVSFEIGPESLACELGDLISVQHDVFRPFDTEAFTYRIAETNIGATVQLDRELVLAPAISYQFVIREADGSITTVGVTMAAGTYPAESDITIDTSVDVLRGGLVVFGQAAKVVKVYEVVQLSLSQELLRKVRAIEWDSTMHQMVALATSPGTPAGYHVSLGQPLVDDNSAASATGLRLQSMHTPGRYRLSWELPDNYVSQKVRVYLRIDSTLGWWQLAEVFGDQVEVTLPRGEPVEIAVAVHDLVNTYQMPDEAAQLVTTPDEFPGQAPPPVQRGEAVVTEDRVVWSWDAIDPTLVKYYEVRFGSVWCGAEVAARVREPRLCLDLPTTDASADVQQVMVRARAEHGLYGTEELAIPAPTDDPYLERTQFLGVTLDPGATGTLTDLVYSSGELAIAAEKTEGTWVSAEQTLGHDAKLLVLMHHVQRGADDDTVDDWNFPVDSGEALWRCVDGRDASPVVPGPNAVEIVDDWSVMLDDMPDERLVCGYLGEVGHRHYCRVDVRTALLSETLSSKPWQPYKPGWHVLGRVQVRVVLVRADLTAHVYAGQLRLRLVG